MNPARLTGILRNIHPTPCHRRTYPMKYNPNISSGPIKLKSDATANYSLSHRNSHLAKSDSLSACHENNENCHLLHSAKTSNQNCHLLHNAEDNNNHCISQTCRRCNLSSSKMSFGRRDFLTVHPALRTSSRHLSTQSRLLLLKGQCMHSVPSRSYFEGLYASLSQSFPVQSTQGLLLEFHHWSGLPWWAVVGLATLTIRSLVVLPLAVHQMQVIGRLARIDAEIRGLVPELNKEVAIARRMYGFDEVHARRVFRKQLGVIRHRMILRDNCHPFKAILLVLFQMPLWICLSIALRNLTFMAQSGIPGALDLKSEGLLWFPDLTAPDPILIPLILLAVNLTLTHVHVLRQKGKSSTLQKVMLNGSRVISVAVAAAATINPSSVSFYWVCSSTFGLCQNLLMASPAVRSALGIPTSLTTPIKDNKAQPQKEDKPK